jgi:hypothetical protein
LTTTEHPDWAELKSPTTAKRWHVEPPTQPGRFLWRRSEKWEPVERDVYSMRGDDRLTSYSHRYCNLVTLDRLEGEWFY